MSNTSQSYKEMKSREKSQNVSKKSKIPTNTCSVDDIISMKGKYEFMTRSIGIFLPLIPI